MYLHKSPSSIYYYRKAVPRALIGLGYPTHIKISLKTKSRPIAIERNLVIAALVQSLLSQAEIVPYQHLKKEINAKIEQLCLNKVATQLNKPKEPTVRFTKISLQMGLIRFIESKHQDGLRSLTVSQLQQRISHFVNLNQNYSLTDINRSLLHRYIDQLKAEGRSAKTNKEYLAAVKQWLSWCVDHELLNNNPTIGVKAQFKRKKLARQERVRWSTKQTNQLFESKVWQQESEAFQWVTRLVLFMGLRPAEACQLRPCDISVLDGYQCVAITDQGEHMRVKSSHAVRYVPIHPCLLSLGFIEWMLNLNQPHIFHNTLKKDMDWSRAYVLRFAKLLNALNWAAGERPTAYGLRHTFIDTLKQKDIAEQVVVDIVGHAVQSLTYGRYGKVTPIAKLYETICQFNPGIGGVYA
ncbi:tyrosine-type recombinase/integrase [Vibrio sp. ZSDE26]|uniref:Tyrosine-type recombinase/integrase n=1 Tax=Vibrio amylolyticus TaxID=2847292 RepID=A0A9X1XJP7_9VIBR|nr:tyrosine-type recombinase/integrase [Vibrio amylolyticus]MCK6263681.1 tyrosine-type recombinase/integrase [Vibrio amylolyticus]